jgi:hypothetical protein
MIGLILLLASSFWRAETLETLADALLDHLGKCDQPGKLITPAEIGVVLSGSGFHKSLRYDLSLGSSQRSTTPGEEHSMWEEGCKPSEVAILQPLPAVLFANIYELQNAAAVGQGPAVRLFGPVDVESIERYSHPTVLAIYLNITPLQQPGAPGPDRKVSFGTMGSASSSQ